MAWTVETQPFGPNRAPLLTGLANDGSGPVPVAVDPATGRLLTNTVGGGGLVTIPFDYISLATTPTVDAYTYKVGGAGGITIATVTITYTDATKSVISTIVKT